MLWEEPPWDVVWMLIVCVCTLCSMEECEALCARLGIMVDGQLQVQFVLAGGRCS